MSMIYSSRIIKFFYAVIERLGIISLSIYWLSFLTIRDKKIVLFGSSFGYSFAGNSKYAYIYMNSIDSKLRPIWISRDDKIVKKIRDWGYESYNIYSLKGIYYALRAKTYVFDHYSKDISFWLSGGTNKFSLWHGIPLKKIHKDNKFDIPRNPRNIFDRIRWCLRIIQNENPSYYYSVTSEYQKKINLQAFAAESGRMSVSGYARTDILLDNSYLKDKTALTVNNQGLYQDILERKSRGDKILIYMPTHRDSEEELFEIIDFTDLNDYFQGNNISFLMKLHIRSKVYEKTSKMDYSHIINLDQREDLYPYLEMSDGLITDYSSIYFDYLLLDKPIIFFAYDIETYIRESRELYYKYEDVTPGEIVRDMPGLIASIDKVVSGQDNHSEARIKLADLMFDFKDGKSAERLYQVLLEVNK